MITTLKARIAGRTKSLPLGRYRHVALVLLLDVVVTAAFFYMVQGQQQARTQAEFERQAETYVAAIQKGIERNLEVVESISGLYAASENVDRDEFREFVRGPFSRHKDIQALEWIPRVTRSRRASHEEAAGGWFPGFQFTEREVQGRMVPSEQRVEYYPVYYVEPLNGNEAAVGFDLGSNPTRLQALERARDTGEPVATARITLVQETGEQFGFLIFQPIYRNGVPRESLEQRRKNLVGYALGVFRIGDMMEAALEDLPEGIVNIQLVDESSAADEGLLYLVQASDSDNPADEEQLKAQGELYLREPLEIPGRQWSLLITPTSEFMGGQASWEAWGVLAGGLLISALLVTYLITVINHGAKTQRLVAEQTTVNEELKTEVSERKQAEEALRLRSLELEALFNIASILAQPGGFEIKSARGLDEVSRVAEGDGVILSLPDQEDRRLALSAVNGKAVDRPQTLHPSQDIADAAFEQGSPIVANDYPAHPLADSSTVALGIVSLMSVPIKADGQTLGVVTVFSKETGHFSVGRITLLTAIGDQLGMLLENARLHDEITVRKELERRMNTFISLASHELRTPMTSIMGFAELLGSRHLPEDTRRDSLEVIVRNTKRLASLVDDLLNVSRIQSGQLAVDVEPIPLFPIVEEEVTAAKTRTRIHQFLVDIPEGIPPVIADKGKLAQIMTNLLDNAVKYSPEGGPISVRAEYQEDRQRVVMSIRDSGIGIAPEHLDGLFTTFGRIQRTETEGIGGSGLGLYLVKELVALQHGEVWVESELDQGSTFFFSIPTDYIENYGNGEA